MARFKMSNSLDLSKIQPQKRKQRTVFTDKQVEDLKTSFNRNPYPDLSFLKELASKTNINLPVLKTWFKNQRAKSKNIKCNTESKQAEHQRRSPEHQRSPQVQHQLLPQAKCQRSTEGRREGSLEVQHQPSLEYNVNTSLSQNYLSILPWHPANIYPRGLIYTSHVMPEFFLSVCPPLNSPGYYGDSHRVIHFGCCSDANMYWLYPILGSQDYFSGFLTLNPERGDTRQDNDSSC